MRHWHPLAMTLILLVLCSVTTRSAMARVWFSGRCDRVVEVDYEAPFAKLPSVARVPLERRLPFGPPRLRLREMHDRVLTGAQWFGFELHVDQSPVRRPVLAKFSVGLVLRRVSHQGRPRRVISERVVGPGVVANRGFNGQSLRLDVPGEPGLYLFELEFRGKNGKSRHRYAEYLRVVKPTVHVFLKAGAQTYGPGEEATFWIENRGTRDADPFGVDFAFERFEDEEWIEAPGSPDAFIRPRLQPLTAGQAGFCNAFEIPSEEPTGLYRFSKTVWIRSLGIEKQLTAEFQIAAPQ